jgi:hypothetical protein
VAWWGDSSQAWGAFFFHSEGRRAPDPTLAGGVPPPPTETEESGQAKLLFSSVLLVLRHCVSRRKFFMFGIPFSGSTVHMNSERNLVRILKWHSRLCVNNGNGVCAGRVSWCCCCASYEGVPSVRSTTDVLPLPISSS